MLVKISKCRDTGTFVLIGYREALSMACENHYYLLDSEKLLEEQKLRRIYTEEGPATTGALVVLLIFIGFSIVTMVKLS